MWHFWKLILGHKQIRKNYFSEILSMSNDLNISDFFTINNEKFKQNITSSKILHVKHKCSASSRRIKILKATQRQHIITTEKLKKICKLFSNTFGKRKSASIKKVEFHEHGCVIQVNSQNLIGQEIMKENSMRYMLA